MSIKLKKIHEDKFPFSNFGFKKLQNIIEKISLEIVLEAKANHRFISRSNNLERSIINTLIIKKNKIISNFKLDNRIANYGKYIHNGFKSWKSDLFLENAINNSVKNLKQLIKQKIKVKK